jgi:DNA repair exonuclease SbcCD ATPase subunit
MEKIDTFTITGLTVEGFKCFANKQHFGLGGMTTITGHNGQGKSSIAEAIAYAITGSHYFGGEQSLDRLYALGGKRVSVEMNIETGDGATHTLTRTRINDDTTLAYDGVAVRQSDLTAMFGEKDVFLSIFNPLYFIETLAEKGRNLLERYLPVVSHEAVLTRIGEHSSTMLENQNMKSPESLLEKVRGEIKELENTVIYVEGQRDLLESQARERREAAKAKRAEIDELDITIGDLEKKRAEGLDFEEMQQKLDNLYARCDELVHDGAAPPDTAEVDAAIQAAITELEKRRAGEYVSQHTDQIAETEAIVAQLRDRYARETSILAGLVPGIRCPMCKQGVTEDNIDAVKKEFTDSISKITAEGCAYNAKLNDLKALDESTRKTFEDFRAEDVQRLESNLDALRAQRVELIAKAGDDNDGRGAALDNLKGEIQSLEVDLRFGNLMPDEGWTLEGYKKDREKLEAELVALSSPETSTGAEEKDADIVSVKNSIKSKRELEDAIKSYISVRMNLMVEGFGPLNRIKIVLYEAVKKTGAVKDVFKFSYDDKPYRYLSLSEKVKAGLEVSELIKRLTSRNYPVFIDNSESVPVIDNVRPSGQIIISQVVRGAPLEVAGAMDSPGKAAA